ncbi:nicotinamide-nucleotide amidohydrolase family protein [Thomasclavelia cocleata]|uniref:nicotinamide-nucleotide amidohydrolase family protein n=1 Tax=Thomasclavelia cocleata TaxID=69824 RepID=UPI00256EE88A|nr:nicotinamide-nucleotide amidohydrolase family protein [Thomasclavelia cocleata]
MKINVEELRKTSRIAIVGHKNADFDCMVSGILLKYIFDELRIPCEFVLQDGWEDPYFKKKVEEVRYPYWYRTGLKKTDRLFLVDHTADYEQEVIGCFDHHPKQAEISKNYVNKEDKTACAKIILEWGESLGIKIPRELAILTIYACYMDSMSFKSSKANPIDKIWCQNRIKECHLDEEEVIDFGYGLTDMSLPFNEYVRTGTKYYNVAPNQKIGSSYVMVKDDDVNMDLVVRSFEKEISDELIAWCFIVNNVEDDRTRILLITKNYQLEQVIPKLLGRGKDIIPPVIEYLNFKNDGTITNLLVNTNTHIATMESCTSGLIASNITDYEGASAILKGSHITYSNEAKVMAGVSKNIIDIYGVYSEETAIDMAWNTKRYFNSDIGIGITGSIGRVDPANKDSISGVIYYQIDMNGKDTPITLKYRNISLDRKELKQKTVDIVLATLYTKLCKKLEGEA